MEQVERAAAPHYRELALVGAAVLVLSTTAFFRVPLLPEIGRDLTMSAGQLGLVTSMYAAGRLLADLPAGRLLERVRATGLLATSATIMMIGSLGLSAAGRSLTVYGAAFALGIASAITNATGMHTFSVAAPRRRRGTSLAVFSTALLAGQALGPFAGGAIAAATSWRNAQFVAAIACLLLVAMLLWSHLRAGHVDHAGAAGPAVADGTAPEATDDTAAGRQWRRHGAALMFVAFAMFFTLGAMPQTLVPLIGAGDLGLPVQWIGAALGIGGVCRLVGGFVGGVLSDRVSRRAALLPGLVLQALGVALVAGAGVPWWLAGIIVMSLASWSISVAATVLADLAPKGRLGPQLGSFRFVGDVGLILGPLLATQVYEQAGRAMTAAAVAALLVVAAVWAGLSVPETGSST
jgi:predicted MFS family arabinose efflux permease